MAQPDVASSAVPGPLEPTSAGRLYTFGTSAAQARAAPMTGSHLRHHSVQIMTTKQVPEGSMLLASQRSAPELATSFAPPLDQAPGRHESLGAAHAASGSQLLGVGALPEGYPGLSTLPLSIHPGKLQAWGQQDTAAGEDITAARIAHGRRSGLESNAATPDAGRAAIQWEHNVPDSLPVSTAVLVSPRQEGASHGRRASSAASVDAGSPRQHDYPAADSQHGGGNHGSGAIGAAPPGARARATAPTLSAAPAPQTQAEQLLQGPQRRARPALSLGAPVVLSNTVDSDIQILEDTTTSAELGSTAASNTIPGASVTQNLQRAQAAFAGEVTGTMGDWGTSSGGGHSLGYADEQQLQQQQQQQQLAARADTSGLSEQMLAGSFLMALGDANVTVVGGSDEAEFLASAAGLSSLPEASSTAEPAEGAGPGSTAPRVLHDPSGVLPSSGSHLQLMAPTAHSDPGDASAVATAKTREPAGAGSMSVFTLSEMPAGDRTPAPAAGGTFTLDVNAIMGGKPGVIGESHAASEPDDLDDLPPLFDALLADAERVPASAPTPAPAPAPAAAGGTFTLDVNAIMGGKPGVVGIGGSEMAASGMPADDSGDDLPPLWEAPAMANAAGDDAGWDSLLQARHGAAANEDDLPPLFMAPEIEPAASGASAPAPATSASTARRLSLTKQGSVVVGETHITESGVRAGAGHGALSLSSDTSGPASAMASPSHADRTDFRHNSVRVAVLGQGASGVVYKAVHVPSLTLVAIKSIPVYDEAKRHRVADEFAALYNNLTPFPKRGAAPVGDAVSNMQDDERGLAAGFDSASGSAEVEANQPFPTMAPCPYITSLYDAFTDPDEGTLNFVIEYMSLGSLMDMVQPGGCKSETTIANMAYRALRGLAFLHEHRIIHRDIKPDNILLNSEGHVKLADMGVVKELTENDAMADTFIGTLTYMAPERIEGEPYSLASDIWSFGLSLLTFALGECPVPSQSSYFELLDRISSSPPRLPSDRYSAEACDFINSCLAVEPTQRPSAAALLEHPFLKMKRAAERAAGQETGQYAPAPSMAGTHVPENVMKGLDDIVKSVQWFRLELAKRAGKTRLRSIHPGRLRWLAQQLSVPIEVVQYKFRQTNHQLNKLLAKRAAKKRAERASTEAAALAAESRSQAQASVSTRGGGVADGALPAMLRQTTSVRFADAVEADAGSLQRTPARRTSALRGSRAAAAASRTNSVSCIAATTAEAGTTEAGASAPLRAALPAGADSDASDGDKQPVPARPNAGVLRLSGRMYR